MKDGFIKTAAASPAIRVADTCFNSAAITECMKEACSMGVKLICFPELAITGSTCGDLFRSEVLTDGAHNALEEIRIASRSMDIVAIIGSPVRFGGKLYNCSVAVSKGEFLAAVPLKKTNRGQSHIFSVYHGNNANSPYGVFGNNLVLKCAQFPEFSIGFDSCAENVSIIVNPAAEGETAGMAAKRRSYINAKSERLTAGYIYAGAGTGESTTDYAFSGHRIIAENGIILNESGLFGEDYLTVSEIDVKLISDLRRYNGFEYCCDSIETVDFDLEICETVLTRRVSKTPFIPEKSEYDEYLSSILAIQSNGLKKRFLHTGAFKLIVGVSGGRDSALALIACANMTDLLKLPRTDIIGISMPCFGTTDTTKSAAEKLCRSLGVTFAEIDIGKSVESHLKDIGHDINNHNTTYENSQARERTQVLMDYANDVNGIVVGTGDLSELALGWATYNGDHMAMYCVNGGVPKTLISDLLIHYCKHAKNDTLKAVIGDILDLPVSPELLPADNGEISQITEDIVGPYILHDFFIYHAFRGFSPKKILRLAVYAFDGEFSSEIILKWLKNFYTRFFMGQFKRSCSPDGVGACCVSLSPRVGLDMPSDAVSKLWLKSLEI